MAVFHRARGNYWIGATRLASSGLASVLVVLSVFAFWGAFSTYRAGNAAKHFSELSGAFDDASAAVAAEESLERKYRLEPSAEVRGGHHKAAVFLLSALGRVQAIGGPADTALINDVLAMHADYLLAIDHMFAAVDVGDTTRANEIDGTEVDPRFDAMEAQVVAASTAHRAAAEQRLDELAYVQKGVLAATPLVFALGIGLVVFFDFVLRAQRRRADEVVRRSEKQPDGGDGLGLLRRCTAGSAVFGDGTPG